MNKENIFYYPVRIHYRDTDAGGVVYHANYLSFTEMARSEYLRSLGMSLPILAEKGILFVVRSAALEYLAPAVLEDLLHVTVTVTKIKRASIRFIQQILRKSDNKVLCVADVLIACVSSETFRPILMPEDVRKCFNNLMVELGE
ncbi:UNVERIFIED_CONTAM: hypothetical protein GTU68_009002 [Idotea baltica]|nr:hypothetical protein [Idotea baltica]